MFFLLHPNQLIYSLWKSNWFIKIINIIGFHSFHVHGLGSNQLWKYWNVHAIKCYLHRYHCALQSITDYGIHVYHNFVVTREWCLLSDQFMYNMFVCTVWKITACIFCGQFEFDIEFCVRSLSEHDYGIKWFPWINYFRHVKTGIKCFRTESM